MIRQATQADADRIDNFLEPYTETSMFLRGNLRSYGIGQSDHANAVTYFIEEYDGDITGIGGLTNGGMVMIQAPDGVAALAAYMKVKIEPNALRGMVGASDQIAALKSALGLDDLPLTMNDVEPLFSLDLDDLQVPVTTGFRLRPVLKSDLPLVSAWRRAYVVEAMGSPDIQATTDFAYQQAAGMIETGNYRLLERDSAPVSFTGFNTTLSDTVQIGGVYTPTDLRSQGFARTAVAMHLSEARDNGVTRAILFASGEPAARAYRGIGFRQIGHFTIVLFGQT